MSFTEAQLVQQVNIIFTMFDKDKSGFLDTRELREYFNYLDIKTSRRQLSRIIQSMDNNGDGAISREQLYLGLQRAFSVKISTDPELLDQYSQQLNSYQANCPTTTPSFVHRSASDQVPPPQPPVYPYQRRQTYSHTKHSYI